MKTIEKRAIKLLENLFGDGVHLRNKRLLPETIKALKEQDKITRHACAENVDKIKPEDVSYNSSFANFGIGYKGTEFIKKIKAHSTIINTTS